ncbi:MAG TPA: PP2C family protein-serine/threonine phosphatase [Candidatus Dormibacteraeota bacterium]|nr:PP2C family protein-serine/threonine phosphatase [Candidatus Dormibacteraeota bacterium]
MQDQVLTLLRGQLASIISGAIFLFMGLATCSIAAIRRRSGVRLFIWLGIWSAMYGAGLLAHSPAVVAALPHSLQMSVPYVNAVTAYLTIVVASLAFLELSLGRIRLLIEIDIFAGMAVALAGIGWFVFGGSAKKFMPYNIALTVCALLIFVAVVAVKQLSDKFLILFNRRVLEVGTLVFLFEALWVNLSRPYYQTPRVLDHLAFAVFLLSFGYVSMQIVFANERRLLSIENELDVARQLQFSILPNSIPEVRNVRIAVAYRPMTAVAGDFYEFIPVDGNRIGFLLADVTGHGVPAALIASMIKVAMQSVVPCAHDPREVLRGLNRILFRQLHDQFVSAAYLWLDTENRKALYSAAGHPPVLRWREGKLERIVSNGLLFGVIPDPDYPVCDLPIHSGDRFLLYTDGVIEPENAAGDSFGHRKLEQVIRDNQSRPPSELLDQLLSEIRLWQPASLPQQDDITLIVIDVV